MTGYPMDVEHCGRPWSHGRHVWLEGADEFHQCPGGPEHEEDPTIDEQERIVDLEEVEP